MKRLIILIMLLSLSIAVCIGGDYSRENLMTSLRGVAQDPSAADAIFSDYMKNAPDLEFAGMIQNMWQRNKPEAVDKCLEEMRNDPSKAGRVKYFEGAQIENVHERIDFARKLIEKDKDLFEAYALMFDTYTQTVFMAKLSDGAQRRPQNVTDKDIETLNKGFKPDNIKMVRIREWKDKGEHLYLAYKYMAYYAVYKNHPDDAYKYMKAGSEMNADWVDYTHLALQAVKFNKADEVEEYAGKFADMLIKQRAIQPQQRSLVIEKVSLSAFIDGGAYDKAIQMITSKSDYEKNIESLFDLARINARKKDADQAFKYLDMALENGFDSAQILKDDPSFKTITADSRWKKALEKAESNWAAGEKARSAEAIKQKIDKPAADWELKDPEGKVYKLSAYKGKKVVVLDFWATWCGPCMRAMPELDKWCKNHKPENVEVFSINTWERAPDKARQLFKDRKYAMTLLMEGDEAAKKYGVSGIPYICVIDKEGKIRYEVKGFDPAMEANLTIWVKDLLK